MATIGSIVVAFGADLGGLRTGVDDSIALLDSLADHVEGLSSQLEAVSNRRVQIAAEVDSSAIDDLQTQVENTTAQVSVSADVEELTDTIEEEVQNTVDDLSETAEVSISADASQVLTAAAQAAAAVEPLRSGVVIPVSVAATAIGAAREAVNAARDSFAGATSAARGFAAAVGGVAQQNGPIKSSVVLAASLHRAWMAADEALSTSSGAARILGEAIRVVSGNVSNQRELTRAIVEGGAAFSGAAAGATLHVAATRAVDRATVGLNAPLRESVRYLAGLGIAYAQTEVSARVASGAASGIAAAMRSGVSPLAAVTTFTETYRRGLDSMTTSAVAATDRQRVFARAVGLIGSLSNTIRGSASGTFDPFIAGFTRAREAGDGYFAAVVRGVSGQINSISVLRNASKSLADAFAPFATGFARARVDGLSFFAAFDRGFTGQLQSISVFRTAMQSIGSGLKITGLSSLFEPLVTGFERARASGQGFIQATARGLSAQVNSSAAYRATRDAVISLGEALSAAGGKIVGYNASTEAGRRAFGLFRASLDAIRSSTSQAVEYFGVLGRSISAAVGTLPGGRSLIEAFSRGLESIVGSAGSVSRSMGGLSGAIRLAGTVMAVGAVASGAYADELRHIGQEATEIRNMADRFGASTQEIEKLRYAAASAGVGLNQLAKGQQNLYTSLSKIKVGQISTQNVREAKFAFDRLGISMEELKNSSPQEVFEEVAKKLTAIKDPADRTAIAFDLFGRQGAAILPALKSLGQIEKDVERLDVTTSSLDFSRLENMAQSFARLNRATTSYREASLAAFSELQAGFNNFRADVVGGLATVAASTSSLAADATKPLAVLFEVFGRIINIILRFVAVGVKIGAAFSSYPAFARFAQALGEKIKEVLEVVEELVGAADKAASALYSALTPDYWTGAEEGGKSLNQQLIDTTVNLGLTVVAAGVAQAAMTAAGIAPGAAFARLAAYIQLPNLSLRALGAAALSTLKFLTVGALQTAVNWVAAGTTIIAQNIAMGVSTLVGWVTPSLVAMVAYVTGMNTTAAASVVASATMAASWVVATAGLALIPLALIAIYQNFDKLMDFFSEFSNVGKLFTFDGAADAAKAAANAIWEAFKYVLSQAAGFVGAVVRQIMAAFSSVKPPPAIDAARSSAKDIVFQRQKVAESRFETQRTAERQFAMAAASTTNAMTMGFAGATPEQFEREIPKPPVEDTEKLIESITKARGDMSSLSFDAAKFGDNASKAASEAQADFDKLQQQLSQNPDMPIAEFEKQAKAIQDRLKENIRLADVITPEQKQQFTKSLQDAIKQAGKSVRDVQAGMVVEGVFFPTSEAISAAAESLKDDLAAELKDIDARMRAGEFGEGQAGMEAAAVAQEEAQRKFQRGMDKIGQDMSFAENIRKELENAFLSPLEMFEKERQKVMNNTSLTDEEKKKQLASMDKQKAESVFGKPASQEFEEKRSFLRFLPESRRAAESRKIDADKRSAAGLDNTPAQQLQLGIDKINDVFGDAGKGTAEYNEAIKKNRDSVLASVGIEKSAVQVRQEARDRLKDLGLTAGEAAQASKAIADSFMSAIGVTKTPFEQFSGELDNIAKQFGMAGEPIDVVREKLKGNAADLALFDRAVKESREKLLQSLGIEKSPQQAFDEQMKKIEEAAAAGPANGGITAEEATKARIEAARKRDEALGADTANNRAGQFAERRRQIEEAYGKDGEKNKEAFTAAMDNLKKSMPGAEPENPLKKFNDSLKELEYLKGSGALGTGEEAAAEFAQRKLNLQAQLQEDLKPSLDKLAPDRRGIEGADTRSKAGVDTFFRILRGNDNPSLKAQLEIARNTKILAQAAENPEAAPVIAQLQMR